MFVSSLYTPFVDSGFAKGPVEQGSRSQRQLDGHRTPGITQSIPIASGPPRLEQCDYPTIPVRVLPLSTPFFLACTYGLSLIAPLTAGGAPSPNSRPSLQYGRAVSRKSECCSSWDIGWRRPQKPRESLPAQPWLTCRQAPDEAEPIRYC